MSMPLAYRQQGDQMMQENMTGVDKRFSGEKKNPLMALHSSSPHTNTCMLPCCLPTLNLNEKKEHKNGNHILQCWYTHNGSASRLSNGEC